MKLKEFFLKSSTGMSYGLFATLIIGVIVDQIGKLVGIDIIGGNPSVTSVASILKMCLGPGIALGIGIALKFDGLKLTTIMATGAIAGNLQKDFFGLINPETVKMSVNEPLTIYLVIMVVALVFLFWKWKTPVDIILIPLVGVIVAVLMTLLISGPSVWLISQIAVGIDKATALQPLLMGLVISLVMGILLTSPISSVAVSTAIGLSGIAAGAAVLGCSVQMIGFAVQSRKDNSVGEVISVGIGTSMLQFKNIVKKPIIWAPTLIATALISPLSTLVFKVESTPVGGGMGTSALVGQLQTFDAMTSSLNLSYTRWEVIGIIFLLHIVLPIILVFAVDFGFRKLNLIKVGDLRIKE